MLGHGCVVGNKIWFFINSIRSICYYDIENKLLEYVIEIQDDASIDYRLFSDIQYYDGRLILIPQAADKIYIYVIDNHCIEKVEIKKYSSNQKLSYNAKVKFSSSVIVDNEIFMIPRRYPAILRFNVDTYEQTYYDEWIGDVSDFQNIEGAYFRCRPWSINDQIYLACFNADMFFRFDASCNKCFIIRKKRTDRGYSAILKIESEFWLMERSAKEILICNEDGKVLHSIRNWPEGFIKSRNRMCFSEMVEFKEKVYLIPFNANMLISIDKKTLKMECIQRYDVYKNVPEEGRALYFVQKIEDKLFLYNSIRGKLELFNLKYNKRYELNILFREPLETLLRKSFLRGERNIITENMSIFLRMFLYSIQLDS